MKINIFDNIKTKKLETFFFILFCIGIIIVSYFHEPRFSEIQAWGISKESIKDILFLIPHYECHSPLWHLILKCFSNFNISPEIGLKIPNLLFMMGAIWLLIFKSPFPKSIRYSLPFTFYLFFQYSIINRPYSIFCFALFLVAILYRQRKERPFLFIFANTLLCLSCLYGIAIGVGIITVRIIELIKNIEKQLQNKSFISIALFFIFLTILLTIIFPAKNSDKYFTEIITGTQFLTYKNYLLSFIFSITGIFTEITYLHCDNFIVKIIHFSDTKDFFNISLIQNCINSAKFCSICLLGLFINIFLIFNFKQKKVLLLFLLPFLLLSILYTIHFGPHHIGLLLIFIIFVYWCGQEINQSPKYTKVEKCLNYVLIPTFIIIQIFWNIKSCTNEILYPASPAKNIANFIKENKLDKYKIMGSYLDYTHKEKRIKHYNVLTLPTMINQYFDKNIFYNLNINTQKKDYILFEVLSNEEEKKYKTHVSQIGIPDIIIGDVDIKDFFDEINYINAHSFDSVQIYKNKINKSKYNIYIREDLYNKLSLK